MGSDRVIDTDAPDQDTENLRVLLNLYTRAFDAILRVLPGQALFIPRRAWDAASATHTNIHIKSVDNGVVIRLLSDEEMDYFSAGGKTQ